MFGVSCEFIGALVDEFTEHFSEFGLDAVFGSCGVRFSIENAEKFSSEFGGDFSFGGVLAEEESGVSGRSVVRDIEVEGPPLSEASERESEADVAARDFNIDCPVHGVLSVECDGSEVPVSAEMFIDPVHRLPLFFR